MHNVFPVPTINSITRYFMGKFQFLMLTGVMLQVPFNTAGVICMYPYLCKITAAISKITSRYIYFMCRDLHDTTISEIYDRSVVLQCYNSSKVLSIMYYYISMRDISVIHYEKN